MVTMAKEENIQMKAGAKVHPVSFYLSLVSGPPGAGSVLSGANTSLCLRRASRAGSPAEGWLVCPGLTAPAQSLPWMSWPQAAGRAAVMCSGQTRTAGLSPALGN